jgi:hypothetical protein
VSAYDHIERPTHAEGSSTIEGERIFHRPDRPKCWLWKP